MTTVGAALRSAKNLPQPAVRVARMDELDQARPEAEIAGPRVRGGGRGRVRSRELGIERGSKLDRLTEEKNVERAINRSVTRERDLGMER